MKKGDPTPEQIIVEYKGTEFKLPHGHKVWKLSIISTNEPNREIEGRISEAKLHKSLSLNIFKKRRYYVKEMKDTEYIPAFTIEKAKLRFTKYFKSFGLTLKIK